MAAQKPGIGDASPLAMILEDITTPTSKKTAAKRRREREEDAELAERQRRVAEQKARINARAEQIKGNAKKQAEAEIKSREDQFSPLSNRSTRRRF